MEVVEQFASLCVPDTHNLILSLPARGDPPTLGVERDTLCRAGVSDPALLELTGGGVPHTHAAVQPVRPIRENPTFADDEFSPIWAKCQRLYLTLAREFDPRRFSVSRLRELPDEEFSRRHFPL